MNRSCRLLVLVCLLSGCAVAPKPRLSAPDQPAEACFGYTPAVERRVETYAGADGKELAYIHYPGGERADTALVYLHGIESHAGWFNEAAEQLSRNGYDVFCLDRRGSGINRESRSFTSGYTPSYGVLLQDLHNFLRPLQPRYRRILLVGLSWGGKLATGYALTHPEAIDGMILITPGIHSRIDVSPAEKAAIGLAAVFFPKATFPIPIEPEMFTSTPAHLDFIRNDPLALHDATARFLLESRRLEGLIEKNIHRNRLPVLLFLAGRDRIIDNFAVVSTLSRGKQEVFQIEWYDDQTHSLQFDAADRLVQDLVRWLEELNTSA